MENMTAPTISIVVPVFNAEQSLAACLDSIVGQSHSALEIILVNDGSSDNSGAICDRYAEQDSRIRVIHKPNGGPSSARNAGLEIATGPWVTFVDSDDYAEPDLCEYLLSLAQVHNADIVQCGAFWEDKNHSKTIFAPVQDAIFSQGINTFSPDTWLFFGNGNWGKLYRRDIIRTVRFDPAYTIGEDLYFNFRVLAQADCIVLGSKAKYHYVQTPKSLFRAAPTRTKLLSCRQMLEHACEEFQDHDVLLRRIHDERYRNGLDICSKVVSFRMTQEQDVCLTIRNEIRDNLDQILSSRSFSKNEKLKFFLIARAWPVYCKLLLWSKRDK